MLGIDIINRFKDGHLVSQFLLSSYCYYHLHLPPMTDDAYDRLCVRLIERWDFIDAKVFPQKSLIEYDALIAGTAYYIPEASYPSIVRSSAYHYFAKASTGELAKDLEPHLLPIRAPRIARSAPGSAPPVAVTPSRPGRIVRTPPRGS